VWGGTQLLGCGALKELDTAYAKIKSMRTSSAHLKQGVAQAVLSHILAEAQGRAYQRLSLETGSVVAFAPARSLYAKNGFIYCDPFADYALDPYSVFMTKRLQA
jgi:putative acetyltransferase